MCTRTLGVENCPLSAARCGVYRAPAYTVTRMYAHSQLLHMQDLLHFVLMRRFFSGISTAIFDDNAAESKAPSWAYRS